MLLGEGDQEPVTPLFDVVGNVNVAAGYNFLIDGIPISAGAGSSGGGRRCPARDSAPGAHRVRHGPAPGRATSDSRRATDATSADPDRGAASLPNPTPGAAPDHGKTRRSREEDNDGSRDSCAVPTQVA